MKVASFNANSIRARLPIIIDWLPQQNPDVLAIQETKVQDQDFPVEPFEALGYHCTFRGQKSYNGVAFLSRIEASAVDAGFADEPHDEPRLLRATFNGLTLVNTYIPQGYLPESDKFQYKLQWFKRLLAYFKEHFKPTDSVLWLGDFNVAPEAIDVHDPETLMGHVCFRPEVHEALRNVMNWGFVDLFRQHCPDTGQYTFWDYRAGNAFGRNRGWRLDHLMGTKPVVQRSRRCYIDKEPRAASRPSDHTPVIVELDE